MKFRQLLAGAALGVCFFAPAGHAPASAQTAPATQSYGLPVDILSQAERNYDVIVAGGSAGGAAAALQARRMGATVALFAETDAVGGQLLTVPSMDEGWMSRNFPSGIYAELISRVNQVYTAKGMSVGGCYW